ncbi:hypothetical protein BTO30_10615 [Domibacillus antri]|uniref:DUF4901 domain-containing protein n=1 Tax=Domibacillus antri TaxID=1714264 RepID=A0A1Q8Q4B9_9BACI|nr:hypothetical protein [Domibacillus antri]OLN22194.1 hypothetical protein BTO30_10615 [Domibacillus antri]
MSRHDQLTVWTEMIQEKFGLAGYTCFETVTSYEKNEWNETDYRFTTEWLPPGYTSRKEDESNPKGTAVIEIDVKTGRLNSIIFVGRKAPENGFAFSNGSKEEVIRWVEQETGWTYGDQFIDFKSDHTFSFKTAYKGTPVVPEGFIDVSLDGEKRLIFFTVHGLVPEQAIEADFQLTMESIEPLAKDRLVFVEYPSAEEEKWLPVYMMDEQLIDNETAKPVQEDRDLLTWKTMKNKKVKRKLVQMAPDELDENLIFDFPPHPDTKPITKKGCKKIREASIEFLQSYVPKESGEWSLSHVKRSRGLIEARLTNIKDVSVVPRTWKLLLHKDSYEVISYIDSSWMLDQAAEYEQAEKPVLLKEEAFEKIKPHLELKPVYVYDGQTYRLYGQIDSKAAVHAASGEILHF